MSAKGSKLSKEQLRALRTQRAAALAAQQQQHAAPPPAAAATSPKSPAASAEADARSMPPPPPRAPSQGRSLPGQQQQGQQGQHGAASYHADSQATRLHDTAGLQAHADAHAEPSINQGGGRAASARGGQEEVRSTVSAGAAPADLFDNHASAVGSAGRASGGAPPAAEAAVSLEGSTGADAAAGAPAGLDVTSSANLHDAVHATGASAVPARFFEHAPAAADSMVGPPPGGDADAVNSPPAGGGGGGGAAAPLPKGFFEDKKADAKARGEVPKSEKDMAKEYADFMKQVEADSVAAAAEQAADEEAEAAGRLDREDFEQFVRMQKLEAIKEARAAGSKRQVGEVDAAAAAAAEELIEPEVERPVIQLPKKRRVADSMAALAAGGGSSSEDEGDAEQGLLDWRAKTSAF